MHMKFYPDEVREEAIRLVVRQRMTTREAAMKLGLRSEIVRVWVNRFRTRKEDTSDAGQLRACMQRLAIERDALAGIAARLLEKTG